MNFCSFLRSRYSKFVISCYNFLLLQAHYFGHAVENINLTDERSKTLYSFVYELCLLFHKALLLREIILYFRKKLVRRLAFYLLNSVDGLLELLHAFGSCDFNLVLGKNVLKIRDLLLRFVGSAKHFGKEQLMGLDVAVNVDVVHTL